IAPRQRQRLRVDSSQRLPRRREPICQQRVVDALFLASFDPACHGNAAGASRRAGSARQRGQIPEPCSGAWDMDAIDTHRRSVRHHAGSGSGAANAGISGGIRHRDSTRSRDLLRIPRPNAVRSATILAALLLGAARTASSQLPPNEDWRTLHTRHFRVHFTPPLEQDARRAAVNAERAYEELSAELVAPRGTIDLVVADNVDCVNGYATPVPSNRIVVYAHPPIDASGLRNYDDWNALVVTHELTHIFHLDRSRGIWKFGQAIFGRNALLFPNLYEPRWVMEGLAVYFESRLTGYGRLESSEHLMTARAAALAGRLPRLQELSAGTSKFPGGAVIYIYGSLLFDYLSRTRGPASIRDFVERGSKTLIPFILTTTSRGAFGVSFETAWREWRDSLFHQMADPHDVMPGWRQLTSAGRIALFPRWMGDTALTYAGDKAREMPAAYEVTLSGREKKLGRRNSPSPNVRTPDGGVLFSQPDYLDPYHIRYDLFVERKGEQKRLTTGA